MLGYFLLSTGVVVGVVVVTAAFFVWLGLRLSGRRRGRSVLRFSIWSLLALYPIVTLVGAPLLFSYLIAHSGTRPMDLRLQQDPSTFGCDFEEVFFQSPDSIELRGWWMQGEAEKPVIVTSHGLFRDRKEVTERACRLNMLGYSALVLDSRRHGGSGQAPVTMGYQERLDVQGGARFAAGRSASGVVLMGVSMGAAAALMAAAEMSERPLAVIADSPFSSLRETVTHHLGLFLGIPSFPFADVFLWNFCRIGDFAVGDFDVTARLREAPTFPPTLLIYGQDDRRMPPEVARRVLDALPGSAKELLFFPGADHGDAFEVDPERYVSDVDRFLGVRPAE